MGALAVFAPARRLLRYALDFMHHVGYWENEVVIRKTAKLFYDYAR